MTFANDVARAEVKEMLVRLCVGPLKAMGAVDAHFGLPDKERVMLAILHLVVCAETYETPLEECIKAARVFARLLDDDHEHPRHS